MATIPLLERDAREHDRTAVSLGFSGCSFLYRISIMGVLSRYYHLFNQNFTGRRNIGTLEKRCLRRKESPGRYREKRKQVVKR